MKINTVQMTFAFCQDDDDEQKMMVTVLHSMAALNITAEHVRAQAVQTDPARPAPRSTVGVPGAEVKVSEPQKEVTQVVLPNRRVKLIFPRRPTTVVKHP